MNVPGSPINKTQQVQNIAESYNEDVANIGKPCFGHMITLFIQQLFLDVHLEVAKA